MAITPGTYNMTVQRRADHSIQLVFKDNNNAAINLTGYTVAAQVWDKERTGKYADFAISYTNRSNGEFKISLTDIQTTQFSPNELAYDVLLVNASDEREYYVEGTIFVSEGYTTI